MKILRFSSSKGEVTFDEMLAPRDYLMYNGDRQWYNGFEHFGQSTLWPRGYPLDMIGEPPFRSYKKCRGVRPLVQQVKVHSPGLTQR